MGGLLRAEGCLLFGGHIHPEHRKKNEDKPGATRARLSHEPVWRVWGPTAVCVASPIGAGDRARQGQSRASRAAVRPAASCSDPVSCRAVTSPVACCSRAGNTSSGSQASRTLTYPPPGPRCSHLFESRRRRLRRKGQAAAKQGRRQRAGSGLGVGSLFLLWYVQRSLVWEIEKFLERQDVVVGYEREARPTGSRADETLLFQLHRTCSRILGGARRGEGPRMINVRARDGADFSSSRPPGCCQPACEWVDLFDDGWSIMYIGN